MRGTRTAMKNGPRSPQLEKALAQKRRPNTAKKKKKKKNDSGDFTGVPVVKNLPSNAGDVGSSSGQRTKIPHAVGQLSPHAPTTGLKRPGARVPQPERENPYATTREKPTHHNKDPECCN